MLSMAFDGGGRPPKVPVESGRLGCNKLSQVNQFPIANLGYMGYNSPMATVHIRDVGDELVKRLKIEALRRGVTFRELVLATLEGLNGDEQGRAEGGSAKDSGKGAIKRGRGKGVRNIIDDAGDVHASGQDDRGEGLRGVRGDISEPGAICGSPDGPQSDIGAVVGSVPEDERFKAIREERARRMSGWKI